jgi:long-subunit fatty acid transport protein
MHIGKRARVALMAVVLVGALGATRDAAAQVDYEIISALQFNFSNPGARSLAMAGALTGAGDDATGAWTNPGGLTNISRPEIGFEFRGFDYSTLFVNGGRFNGTPSGLGVDTVSGVNFGESQERTNSLSFVSAVLPRSRLAFAFYRTEVANFETAIETDGVFFNNANGAPVRIRPVLGFLDTKVSNIGGSAAVRLTDQVSVGVGLSVYQFELQSLGQRFAARSTGTLPQDLQPGFFLGPPLYTDANLIVSEIIEGDDTAFGVNVGASFNPSDKVRIGVSYRQGPAFDIDYSRVLPDGSLETSGDSEFRLPDVLSIGFLLRPSASLNIAFDYRRVGYSRMTEGMEVVIGNESPDDFFAEDANEVRGAVEFLRPIGASILALRGGVWLDPDHRIQYRGSDIANSILYTAGDDEVHVTAGAGIVINNAFQIDGGYDHSERVKTFSVSAIYRF